MKLPLLLALVAAPLTGHAASLGTAELTKAINDVRVLQPSKPAASATVGQKIAVSSSIQTGRQSRAELTFADQTVARIGANSLFTYRPGNRQMEIQDGSFLLQVPKNAGGATIRTATVTAAITGTTTLMEYSAGKYVKFITLEGTAAISIKKGKSKKNIPPGHMLVFHPDADSLPEPVIINVQKLIRTSNLVNMGPLAANFLINQTVRNQVGQRRNGDLIPSGIIVRGPATRPGSGTPPSNRPGGLPNDNPPSTISPPNIGDGGNYPPIDTTGPGNGEFPNTAGE